MAPAPINFSILLIEAKRASTSPFHTSLHQSTTMSVKLESSDEQVFEVPREIAEMSVTVKHMLDDVDADSDAPIPLPNVTGKILAKVPPVSVSWSTERFCSF